MSDFSIALTFSGGGYRATAYHLGTLWMLHHLKVDDGTLLEHVEVLSTISGGSITGLRYMQALAEGEDIDEMVDDVMDFMRHVDLVTDAFRQMDDYDHKNGASAIRTMKEIYDEKLFKGCTFGKLLERMDYIPVNHYAANGTDFSNGYEFRFQISDLKRNESGNFGNALHCIPREAIQYIRLSEALACSSCFPGGFEPMIFPDDFAISDTEEGKKLLEKYGRFAIMDGGAIDNQGIEPVLLAEERMRNNSENRKECALDLVIVNDVSHVDIVPYVPKNIQLPKWLNKLNLNRLTSYANWITTLLAVAIIPTALFDCTWLLCVLSALFAVSGVFSILVGTGRKKVKKAVESTFLKHSVGDLLTLRFSDLGTLFFNRATSMWTLTDEVYMKQIRTLQYKNLFQNSLFTNRAVANPIYEMEKGETFDKQVENGKLPEFLRPSQAIRENSKIASHMATTLWFSEEDKAKQMQERLFAAGRYSICFVLLRYIHKLKTKNNKNITERHQLLLDLEPQLKEYWERYQKNPLEGLASPPTPLQGERGVDRG